MAKSGVGYFFDSAINFTGTLHIDFSIIIFIYCCLSTRYFLTISFTLNCSLLSINSHIALYQPIFFIRIRSSDISLFIGLHRGS